MTERNERRGQNPRNKSVRPSRPRTPRDDRAERPARPERPPIATPGIDLLPHVLFRDDSLIVIDKPAGIPVHAGPKGGVTIEHGFPALRFGLPWDPQLGHRLDKDTSGCLVLGRDRKALGRLGKLFTANRIEKTYWAVVEGGPSTDTGRIALSLSKREKARGWHMRVDPKGQPAETYFRVLGRSERLTWLELKPKTGRTHQLRVHCSAKGWPILGDTVYAKAGASAPRLHLHARSIELPFYPNAKSVRVTAPVPDDMIEALKLCGWKGESARTPRDRT
ncbi:MAG: RNA pseudouridine synthase [Hyphomicrobiales bacterium]|nr:MAG: RNA pseudouridine synthase [Hyphomicrobiales bacterium]